MGSEPSSVHTTAHSNAGSPTHWARPGIEPASSWILVGFISTVPQWELPSYFLYGCHNAATPWKSRATVCGNHGCAIQLPLPASCTLQLREACLLCIQLSHYYRCWKGQSQESSQSSVCGWTVIHLGQELPISQCVCVCGESHDTS